jgi:integration host factor subunit beta
MNRSELVEMLAVHVDDMTRRDAESAVDTIFKALNDALAVGRRIEIRGFGVFSVVRRPMRMGRNPRNGASVLVPEKRALHFKPGKSLREGVAGHGSLCAPGMPREVAQKSAQCINADV